MHSSVWRQTVKHHRVATAAKQRGAVVRHHERQRWRQRGSLYWRKFIVNVLRDAAICNCGSTDYNILLNVLSEYNIFVKRRE